MVYLDQSQLDRGGMMVHMTHRKATRRHQFRLRTLLAAITWLTLVIAVCVQHQQASRRQRQVHEHFMSLGFPPFAPAGRAAPISPQSNAPPMIKFDPQWPALAPS